MDNKTVNTEKIKEEVRSLSSEKLSEFRQWFAHYEASVWDNEFEKDAASGRLDYLADEALKDLQEGRCTEL